MYIETRSKTIEEATDKLFEAKKCDFVFGCTAEALNDAQKMSLRNYVEFYSQYDVDIDLALSNLFINLTDDHIYVLEVADDGDEVEYYYCEMPPAEILYKDTNGNLYHNDGMNEDGIHCMVLVEQDTNGEYIYTDITWYVTHDEFAEYTVVRKEV